MNAGEIASELRNLFDGFDETAREILRNRYIFAKLSRAVVEVKKELRTPVRERDILTTAGERGINLPSDFLEMVSARIDANAEEAFEGYPLELVDEITLQG